MVIKSLLRRIKSAVIKSAGSEIIQLVKSRNLTYLSQSKLNKLADLTYFNERNNIAGIIIETGCALGGSGIVMASCKAKDRPQRIYDVFGMIPPPSNKDGDDIISRYDTIKAGDSKGIAGEPYYGYMENLYDTVIDNFAEAGHPVADNNVSLHKGLLQDTLVVDEPVSLAHIDVDWYDPVYVSLERIYPHLSMGGTIVADDYLDWSGCKSAVDDFFKDKKEHFKFDTSCGSMVITKVK